MKHVLSTLFAAALSLAFVGAALAVQPNPYDSHTRVLLDDGNNNIAGNAANPLAVNTEGQKATYRYSGLAFSPVATPTDFIVIQGSATKTIRVKHIALNGIATTAGVMPIQIVKRTSAPTLGSAVLTAVTAGKHDSTDAAATAVVSTVGTANITTLGTAAGVIGVGRLSLTTAASALANGDIEWEFALRSDKPVILRGATEYLVINANAGAVPAGGAIDYEIETEEDNS